MKELFLRLAENLLYLAAFGYLLFFVPYFIRLGWGKAANKTKYVCDICWRDINKVSKMKKSIDKLK